MSNITECPQFLVEILNSDMGYYFRSSNLLYEGKSRFQDVEVHEFPGYGKVLRLDNIFQTSDWDEFLYHEPLAHVAGISMAGPRKALVIGGGDGGMIEELIKYNTLEKVVMVELDEKVVEVSKRYLPSISNGAFDSPKTQLLIEDGIAYIENSREKFDLIILDLTDPIGPSVMLYTKEFYQSVANILSEKGALTLHVESPISRPKIYSRLLCTLKSVFQHVTPMLNYVPMYGTLWGYAIASNSLEPTKISKDEIEERISEYGLSDLRFYNSDTHHALLALPNYVRDLLKEKQPPFSKEQPIHIEQSEKKRYALFEKNNF